MKLFVDNYEVESCKINKDKNIISLADLHINCLYNHNILNIIIDYIKNNPNIEIVAIPGDMMNSWNYNNSRSYTILKYFVSSLAETTKVILTLGNHDVFKMNSSSLNKFLKLNRIKNVYALINESIQLDDIILFGFSGLEASLYNNDIYISQLIQTLCSIDSSKYNILLNHDPLRITDLNILNEINEYLEYVDLILAGHLHNGYIPNNLDYQCGDLGLIETKKLPFYRITPYCRGIHDVGNSKLLVTKGVRKYAGYITSIIPTNPSISQLKLKKN